jgi:hypothetical protein
MCDNFYDVRSRFVHGDFEIQHPCGNEMLDKEVDAFFDKLIEPYELAFSIVLATLQKMIESSWNDFVFSEIFYGKPE